MNEVEKPKIPELGSQEDLVRAFTHDAKNSITSITVNVSFAHENLGSTTPQVREALSDASESAARLLRQVENLMVLTRAGSGLQAARRDVTLAHVIDGVVRLGKRWAAAFGVTVRASVAGHIQLIGEPELIGRALSEVFDLAIQCCGPNALVEVGAAEDGDDALVWVRHDGRGLETNPKLVAWVAGSRRLADIGFGLAVASVAAEAHGGTLDVRPTSDWSAEILMRLPRAR